MLLLWMAALTTKKKILFYVKMKPLQCKLYLLPLVIAMWLFPRHSLHPLCSHRLSTGILWRESPLSLFFSSQKSSNSFSLFSQGRFPNLWSSSWPFFGFSCFLPVFLGSWAQPCTHYSRCSPSSTEWSGMTMSAPLLVMLQGLICLCHFSSALLTFAQLIAHQGPPAPFSMAAPQPHRAELALGCLSQGQDHALVFAKLHAAASSPLYQPVQVSKVVVSSDTLSWTEAGQMPGTHRSCSLTPCCNQPDRGEKI